MSKKRTNGEGSIRKRKDGRWEGRYTAGRDPQTGKRIIKNVLGKTQAEAREKLKAAMTANQGITVARSDDYAVATWLKTWYELYAKPNIRTATANRYDLMINIYAVPRIGNIKLNKLTGHDLQKLYKGLMENGRVHRGKQETPGLSSTTVRSLHLMLHCALQRAVKARLIPRNPTEDCVAPKIRKVEMKILKPEDISTYLTAADRHSVLPMFYLELVSGLRKGELVALLWSDLDVEARTISVSKQYVRNPDGSLALSEPKTEASIRQVSIPQAAVNLLIEEHAKHPPVPLPPHRRNVPPGLGGELTQKNPAGRGTGAHPLPRPAPHLRDHGAPERGGREDRLRHAGALRRWVHPPHIHPRHPANAEAGGGDDGRVHGTGHVE